jgi:hypothetical protein
MKRCDSDEPAGQNRLTIEGHWNALPRCMA